jgi:hypothetical protein
MGEPVGTSNRLARTRMTETQRKEGDSPDSHLNRPSSCVPQRGQRDRTTVSTFAEDDYMYHATELPEARPASDPGAPSGRARDELARLKGRRGCVVWTDRSELNRMGSTHLPSERGFLSFFLTLSSCMLAG